MNSRRVVVVGGGAAGIFAAIACAEASPGTEVAVLEKSPQFLAKVRISGGGRCNVTHACFDAREFATRYPRGGKELIGSFHQFSASETVAWFASRGVRLKTEGDGRMFPTTNSSQTIIECLLRAAGTAGVKLRANCGVESVRCWSGGFEVMLSKSIEAQRASRNPHPGPLPFGKGEGGDSAGETLFCDRLLLATGGCRAVALGKLAVALGHTLAAPVPSLFTFHIEAEWLRELAGLSVESAEISVPGAELCACGPVLVTHWGLSGPAILGLSAWGARKLHALDYKFPLLVNWLPEFTPENFSRAFQARRESQGAKLLANAPLAPLPARLWESLVGASGLSRETRWASLTSTQEKQLVQQLTRTELAVAGKSLNKEEFVTCGGVRLAEVNFKTMESRRCPGLYFAGELLDLDGLTGGFNFQAAWTTGWIAGRAMADS
jgi:predicted flavoprotein YhiN